MSTASAPHIRRMFVLLPLLFAGLLACLPAAALQTAAEQTPATTTAPTPPAPAELPPPETDLLGRFDFTFDKVVNKLEVLVASLPLLLAAIVMVALAGWLGGVVSRRLHWLRLRTANPYMNGLIRNVVRILITLIGVVLALELLDATALVTAVLGSAGVVGLVLGFAFKDIAENYVAGILLSLRQPFAPGDHVVVDGNEGKVVALLSRSTVLMTLDGNELRLPNALVFKAIVLNYSRNPRRRFDFGISIDVSQSIHASQELAIAQIRGIDGVLDDPGPSWTVHEYTPAGIALRFFAWVDQRESDLGKVRSEAIRRVKAAFAHAGIEGPRTIQHVLMTPSATIPDTGGHVEPVQDAVADTSVNRDIDEQLAEAQQAADGGTNLLEPAPVPPP